MKEQEIYGIFPTPIYRSKLNRNFTKKELNFFDKIKCKPNKYHLTINTPIGFMEMNLISLLQLFTLLKIVMPALIFTKEIFYHKK